MDGNGRWAKKRYLPREAGHFAGMGAVRETVRAACDMGLENLTLFAFSSENWKRPKTEVGALMGLFRAYFRSDMDELVDRNVRMRIIGHRGRVAADILQMIQDAESRTAKNTGMNLTFAFDYGGQEEIAAAAQELARAAREGRLDPETITPELFAARLFTSALPEPDLVIRTCGRASPVQFPALAIGLCRASVPRHPVAGFRPRRAGSGAGQFAARERRFGALDSGSRGVSVSQPRQSRPGEAQERQRELPAVLFGVFMALIGDCADLSQSRLVCRRHLPDDDAGGARMASHGARSRPARSRRSSAHPCPDRDYGPGNRCLRRHTLCIIRCRLPLALSAAGCGRRLCSGAEARRQSALACGRGAVYRPAGTGAGGA